MSYQLIVTGPVMEAALTVPVGERRRSAELLRSLTEQPSRADDRERHDEFGRSAKVRRNGHRLVVFRVDHLLKEVFVVGIERASLR